MPYLAWQGHRTEVRLALLLERQRKDNLGIKLINFNLIKTNIKRMASEIPTNLLIISNLHLINPDKLSSKRRNLIMIDELKNLKL